MTLGVVLLATFNLWDSRIVNYDRRAPDFWYITVEQ